jgi:uncharacterized membrane protein
MQITVLSLALKRISYLLATLLVAVVAPQLMSHAPFDWLAVADGAKVALGYWLVTTFRDYQDPTIPKTPEK